MLPVPPLPPIGLPLPRIGLPPLPQPRAVTPPPGPERGRGRRHSPAAAPLVIVAPVIVTLPSPVPGVATHDPAARRPEQAMSSQPAQPLDPPVDPVRVEPSTRDTEPTAERPAPAVASGPVYIIPGCYAGNVPPVAQTLPRGCDATLVTVLSR